MAFSPTALNRVIARILSKNMGNTSLKSLQVNIKLPLVKKDPLFISALLKYGTGRNWGNRAEKQARREEAGNNVIG